MSLSLSAVVAGRDVDVALSVPHGETLAVLGPNGAGKSTLLAVAAGLLRPDRGRCDVDGGVVHDLATGAWTPPHARGVALLAQEPLLFPHLTVRENVAFGPRSTGAGRVASRERADRWLAEVDASDLADRRPRELSGGQAQRVAVARALAAEPSVLLLDEPMAALDVAVAPVLRQVLRRVLADRTAVVVTHDVLDALVLASSVVVVEAGRVVEAGPTREVLTRPRSAFAARIAGLNLVAGTYDGDGVRGADGVRVSGLPVGTLARGGAAVAVFDPAAVAVHVAPPGGSPRNVLAARVTELEPRGAQVRVRAGDLVADVTAAAVAELDLVPGSAVHLVVKASEVAVYAG